MESQKPTENPSKMNMLAELPLELTLYILSKLEMTDLLRLSLVSKAYHDYANANLIWKPEFIKLEQTVLNDEKMKTAYEKVFKYKSAENNFRERYKELDAFIRYQKKYQKIIADYKHIELDYYHIFAKYYGSPLDRDLALDYDHAYEKVDAYYKTGDIDNAIASLENIIIAKATTVRAQKTNEVVIFTDPQYAKVNDFYYLGLLYLEKSDYKKAYSSFVKAHNLGCLDADLFYYLGELEVKIGELEKKPELFEEAISSYKNYLNQYLKSGKDLKDLDDKKVKEVEMKISKMQTEIGKKAKSGKTVEDLTQQAAKETIQKPGIFSSQKTKTASEKAEARKDLIKRLNKL